jgi:hypothetical protein
MRTWLSKNLNSIIIGSFLIPILLVAFVSISHVTTFYNLANPITWAAYLSIAVEIAALAALAGVSAKFGKFIYIPFGIVTFIQLLGNFFFSYTWININSKEFKDWMEMVGPLLEPLGVDSENPTSHRTVLAFFTGGLLPFISLTFAHMLIVYSNKIKTDNETEIETEEVEPTEVDIDEISKEAGKMEKEISEKYKPYIPTEEDLKKLQELFENKQHSEVVETKDNDVDLVNVEPTPEPTPEPIYYVDDEPIVEETPQINRLVYTKNE